MQHQRRHHKRVSGKLTPVTINGTGVPTETGCTPVLSTIVDRLPLVFSLACLGCVTLILSRVDPGLTPTQLGVTPTQMGVTLLLIMPAVAICSVLFGPNWRRAAQRDGKTGMLNATYFDQQCQRACAHAKRGGVPLSLILLDLDFLKAINDAHGHFAGDRVLVDVCVVLSKWVYGRGFVSRFGGDEFVIALPGCTAFDALHIADAIRRDIARAEIRVVGMPEMIRVTASLSIAELCDLQHTYTQLFDAADMALLHAKRQGRNLSHVTPPLR